MDGLSFIAYDGSGCNLVFVTEQVPMFRWQEIGLLREAPPEAIHVRTLYSVRLANRHDSRDPGVAVRSLIKPP